MKRMVRYAAVVLLCVLLSACQSPCDSGHTWEAATCKAPKTCSVCGETEGEPSSHTWEAATCKAPKTCSVCGETEGEALSHTWVEADCITPKTCSVCGTVKGFAIGHNYDSTGVCTICSAHKEYQNSYGYFSESDLQSMASTAIANATYPAYVYNFDYSKGKIEKITDSKMMVGGDCFTVVGTADFSSNGTVKTRAFAVIIEPRSSTKYVCKDYYVQ